MCRLMNLDPALVLTNRAGEEMGAGTYHAEQIRLLRRPDEAVCRIGLQRQPRTGPESSKRSQPGFIKQALTRALISRNAASRVRRREDVPVTPKAVICSTTGTKSNPPSYQYDRCIRCYCCQELCRSAQFR
ncbi:MAG: hypothetical protein R2912_05345 [Eubacteriales bacterium]